MKIGVGDQGPVFRDGCFSHPGHVFILGCERGSLMRVYRFILIDTEEQFYYTFSTKKQISY